MILMILFGFEVDTLEIALREQYEVVDKIFVVESSFTHQGVEFTASQYNGNMSSWPRTGERTVKILNIISQDPKPLIWQSMKTSDRFSFLDAEKIEAVIVSNVSLVNDLKPDSQSGRDIWHYEEAALSLVQICRDTLL